MAKPIQIDIPVRDHQKEIQQRLAEAPTEHAAALLEFLELLEVLHDRKVLSALRGAVGASDEIVSQIAKAAAQPESIRGLRNMLALAKIFGEIDPELIDAVQRSIPPQLRDRNLRRQTPAPSIFQIARTVWSPPARRALMAFGLVLAGVGYYMNKERPSTADKV
ncbi:MAG TPA: DUF1641 domain-containing protein [Acidobacteriaceae bacterium]|jgi:uncharacterized protein YjgD (DUF1641 family)|nr:DUF1641 domain-containing protein [Acidobacteriaceae bacterium]